MNAKTRSPWHLLGKITFRQIQYRNINPPPYRIRQLHPIANPQMGQKPKDLFSNTLHNPSVSASPDYYYDANKR